MITLFLFIQALWQSNLLGSNNKNIMSVEDEYAIIFIHGTYTISFESIRKTVLYNIYNNQNSEILPAYQITERFNKPLNQHSTICGNVKGLEKISTAAPLNHTSYHYIFNKFNKKASSLLNSDKIEYYAYNWSGLLSHKARQFETKLLFSELNKIKKKNPKKKIIIIAFSHGGNIALELAQIAKNKKSQLKIDLLILMATPIGTTSEINAQNNFFCFIINIYSDNDYAQIADIFFHFPYPNRYFKEAKNVINLKIKYIEKIKIAEKQTIKLNHKYFSNIESTIKQVPEFFTILLDIMNNLINIKEKNENSNNYDVIVEFDNIKNKNGIEKNYKIEILPKNK